MGYLDAVAISEVFDVLWQLVGMRHACLVHQDRDYGDIPGQSRSHFEADEIVRVLKPPLAIGFSNRGPLRSDDDEKDTAAGYVVIDGFPEVDAGRNSGDIHEHCGVAVGAYEVVVKSPCFAFGIVPSVANKDGVLHPSCVSHGCRNDWMD